MVNRGRPPKLYPYVRGEKADVVLVLLIYLSRAVSSRIVGQPSVDPRLVLGQEERLVEGVVRRQLRRELVRCYITA